MKTAQAMEKMTEVIRRKQLVLRTEQCCCAWLRRYCDYLDKVSVHLTSEQKVERWLMVLTKDGGTGSAEVTSLEWPLGGKRAQLSCLQGGWATGERASPCGETDAFSLTPALSRWERENHLPRAGEVGRCGGKRQRTGALQDAGAGSEGPCGCGSVLDCASPLALLQRGDHG